MYNEISLSQFDFIRGRSTVQQLLLYFDHIYSSVSTGFQVDAIYLDIWKAFESVHHMSYFLNCVRLKFLASFGIGLDAIVPIASDLLPVLSGLPQGEHCP